MATDAGVDDEAVTAIIFVDPATLPKDERIGIARSILKPLTRNQLLKLHFIRLSTHLSRLGGDAGSASRATSTMSMDGAERAMLFGRYVNQINARIERAWMRPHVKPGGPNLWAPAFNQAGSATAVRFRCRVQIKQSGSGRVLEVTLLDCNSNPEWQQSLVNAIEAASPLPAPPNPAVFARSLVLNFTSAVPPAGALGRGTDPGGTW